MAEEKIDTILFNGHYYLVPQKDYTKPFMLFHETLNAKQVVGVGHFVMHDKEHICVIKPYHNNVFLLTTLHYAYELLDPKGLALTKATKITTKEKDLAKMLIAKLTRKHFNIGDYTDQFAQKLLRKIKAGKKKALPEQKQKQKQKKEASHTLMQMLKKSLDE